MGKPNRRNKRQPKEKPEFDQTIADLARVTRVTKGGKHLSFRALVLIGDRKGRVGYGVQKGADVQIAVDKAVRQAKKNIINVPFDNETIPHAVQAKYKAGKVLIKPAPQGSGIIAGSVIRSVLELAGVPNASEKMKGKTNNKIANVKATFEALCLFKQEAVNRVQKNRDMQKKNKIEKVDVKKKEAPKKDDKKAPKKAVKKAAPKKAESAPAKIKADEGKK